VIVFDPGGRVLLLRATLKTSRDFWVVPGGGLEPGETWEQAAHREILEETGLTISLGPIVWIRNHVFSEAGKDYNLHERFFVGRSDSDRVAPRNTDSYVIGHRWWSVEEILASDVIFAPRRFKELIVPIVRGIYPDPPIESGV